MRARDADANRSCSESTTSRQTAPAKKLRRWRLIVRGIVSGGTESKSLLLRRFEAGKFLDKHVAVGALVPLEGSDAGPECLGHGVELFAVGHIDDVGWSVGEILRFFGLEHLVQRRIEKKFGDAGLRLPGVASRSVGANQNPAGAVSTAADFPLARLDHAVLGLENFLDAGRNTYELVAFVGVVFLGSSRAAGLFH